MADCRPELYMTRDEHDRQCERQHKDAMEWAHDVVKIGKDDRKDLWLEVRELQKIPGKIQTWFIILLIAGILVPVFVNKFMKNGEEEMFKRQFEMSATNDANIQTIMNHLNLPYKAPQIYKPGDAK